MYCMCVGKNINLITHNAENVKQNTNKFERKVIYSQPTRILSYTFSYIWYSIFWFENDLIHRKLISLYNFMNLKIMLYHIAYIYNGTCWGFYATFLAKNFI